MREQFEATSISSAMLKQYMKEAATEGCRLVQIHANRLDGQYRIIYTLAQEYTLTNFELVVSEDAPIESISSIYPSAQLFEQEMAELFGVNMIDMPDEPHVKLYHVNGHPMQ